MKKMKKIFYIYLICLIFIIVICILMLGYVVYSKLTADNRAINYSNNVDNINNYENTNYTNIESNNNVKNNSNTTKNNNVGNNINVTSNNNIKDNSIEADTDNSEDPYNREQSIAYITYKFGREDVGGITTILIFNNDNNYYEYKIIKANITIAGYANEREYGSGVINSKEDLITLCNEFANGSGSIYIKEGEGRTTVSDIEELANELFE